jgi:transaldolase
MSIENNYLKWLSGTKTNWWNDSANINELMTAISNGAVGATTNPLLVKQTLYNDREMWLEELKSFPSSLSGAEKAEELIKRVTKTIASKLEPIYIRTEGRQGYACAQVNPKYPGDVEKMIPMAGRLHSWAPNIAVKLPVTAAGLDALEECAAMGITITATVSFTVPQAIAIAERYQKGKARAVKAGIMPGRCFAVLMIGRIDDYLKDVAHDSKAAVEATDLTTAGIAIAKKAYAIFQEKGYEATIMPAAMRGAYHATNLSDADMVFSVHPKIQKELLQVSEPFEEGIQKPVDKAALKRLMTMREFARAYEPDGMKPQEFITYGVEQKTLSQFVEAGWAEIEKYPL